MLMPSLCLVVCVFVSFIVVGHVCGCCCGFPVVVVCVCCLSCPCCCLFFVVICGCCVFLS